MVATKAALSIRVDALTDADGKSETQAPSIGIENRAKLEARLRALEEGGNATGIRGAQSGRKQQRFQMTGDTKTYNTAADDVDLVPAQREPAEAAVQAVLDVKAEKKREKEERRAKRKAEKEKAKVEQVEDENADENAMEVDSEEDAKEKKRKRRESEPNGEVVAPKKVSIDACVKSFPTNGHCRRMRRLRLSERRGRKPAKQKRPQRQLQQPLHLKRMVTRPRKRSERRRRRSSVVLKLVF